MQDRKSAREKTIAKLRRKLGMHPKGRLVQDADNELWSISQGFERLRDDKLTRFAVTLIQMSN